MAGWLIDSNGDIWQEGATDLRAADRPLSMADFLRYAVATLGFAHIVERRQAARLAWRPTLVTEPTFAGTLMALSGLRQGRVIVSTLASEWNHRICASKEAAKAVAVEAFGNAVSEHGGPFTARRRRIESLPQDNALGRLHAALAVHPAAVDPVALWAALDRDAGGRYVLIKAPEGGSAPLRVVVWGGGYRTFDSGWASTAAGSSLEDQPDRAYGRWAAETYRAVERAGQPRLEEVEASIWVRGRGRTTSRYTRLVLPVEVRGQGRCVLSTALPFWAP